MTPPPGSEDHATPSGLSTVPEDDDCADDDSDKKPTKKRKSWGQVLPEPKTNLPPRKRAKTEDEKEQRRVERVLRNRRAAQSSRERKRLEVEALEKRNQELEDLLATAQKTNFALLEELKRHRQGSGVISTAGSPLDHTLSSQLFGAEAGQTLDPESLDKLVATPPTVNPASLSPPPDDPQNQEPETAEIIPAPKSSESAQAAASDMTQRPAAMLCDLQCLSEPESLPLPSRTSAWMTYLAVSLSTSLLSMCQRPLTQIALSLKAGFSILPSPPILTTIIWLVTNPTASSRTTSTSMSGSTNPTTSPTLSRRTKATPLSTSSASSRKASTLRVKLLRKILSSSPSLARPLQDATSAALRLVSSGHDDRVVASAEPGLSQYFANDELTNCLRRITLPSRETLLALLWTIQVEQRRISKINNKRQVREGSRSRPESGVTTTPTPDVSVVAS